MTHSELAIVVKAIAPVLREYLGTLTERVKELETLAKGEQGERGERGPEGPVGQPGRDGLPGVPGINGDKGIDGTNGADGLGFDDMAVLHDGERTVTLRFIKGDRVKDFPVVFAQTPIYRGVYVAGKSYAPADSVTWGGSEWHCNEPTASTPGDGSKSWTLKVKRGRDGKDKA
jgi:hypothetical protein